MDQASRDLTICTRQRGSVGLGRRGRKDRMRKVEAQISQRMVGALLLTEVKVEVEAKQFRLRLTMDEVVQGIYRDLQRMARRQ